MTRYIRGERIGTGGTASVYTAVDTRMNRTVALKVLHPHIASDAAARTRLEHEVRVTMSLTHTGIVSIYDFGVDSDEIWMAMELMTGGDLRERILRARSLSPPEVTRLADAVLDALSAAHGAGIVHRDLKPRNILFDESGNPKIADFGLAQTAAGDILGSDSDRATIAGTVEYCAPEAVTSGLWDARTDLYALGCTLYETLVGEPPFVANTPDAVLRAHVESDPPHLPAHLHDQHPRLADLVETLLQKDPNDRFQSAEEAKEYLDEGGRILPIDPDGKTQSCGSCGAPISAAYPWCFRCGRPTIPAVRNKRGGYTVLVGGPGKPGDKISPTQRDLCVHASEAAGLVVNRLRKQLPRVPFVLARSLNRGAATRLRDQLIESGLEVELVGPGEEGRRTVVRRVARKTLAMAPRVYLIMAGMSGSFVSIINSNPGAFVAGAFGAVVLAIPAALGISYSRASVEWGEGPAYRLRPGVADVLQSVRDPLLHARMRSVVSDADLLTGVLGESAQTASYDEIPSAVDQTVAEIAAQVLSLSALKASARSAGLAAYESTDAAGREEAAAMLREAEATYIRVMARISSTSLSLRRLALRYASAESSLSRSELRDVATEIRRLGDEIAAVKEVNAYLEWPS